MAQEEHILSNTDSGGGSGVGVNKSKNVKQKKVPQRGLGVAQLEKIRLEEQRKREALQAANVLAINAIGSSASDISPCLAIQCPNFGPSLSPCPNSVITPSNFPSSNASYRSAPLAPVLVTKQINDGGREIGIEEISSPGNESWPRLWKGDYNLDGEKQRVDRLGHALRSQENIQYEPNAQVLPLPGVPQRLYQFQLPSSSVVIASSGISPLSVLSSQMEPPSNQSLHGNSYAPSSPGDDKMVGMKRSYPFSLESPPAPSLAGSFHPTYAAASKSRSDELHSCSSGHTAQTEPRIKYIRDSPSISSSLPEQKPSDIIRDEGRLNGDFLTLAPPSSASPPLNSKTKHALDYLGHQGPELSEFKGLHSQENPESLIHQMGPSGSTEQPFNFFPARSQIGPTVRQEKRETIDLDLKL